MKAEIYFFKILSAGKSDLTEEILGTWGARLLKMPETSAYFLGMHEGTMLSEEACDQGLETESFTVDAGLAPHERDWVSEKSNKQPRFYFSQRSAAAWARKLLVREYELSVGRVQLQKDRDWNRKWSKAFKGIELNEFVIQPCLESAPKKKGIKKTTKLAKKGAAFSRGAAKKILKIRPGAGFGTGTHETTQLCLNALSEGIARLEEAGPPRSRGLKNSRSGSLKVLDFGSGSGILAIGACLLGKKRKISRVDAVEIDDLAIENAQDNAKLNGVSRRLRFLKGIPRQEHYDIVVANILKPILLDALRELVKSLKSESVLILSGLVEDDVNEVIKKFSQELKKKGLAAKFSYKITKKKEWRAIQWNLYKG